MNVDDFLIQHKISNWLLREYTSNNMINIKQFGVTLAVNVEDRKDIAIICRGINWQDIPYILIAVADARRCNHTNKECVVTTISSFITALNKSAQSRENNPIDWLRQANYISNDIVNAKFKNENGSSLAAILIQPEYGVYSSNVGGACIYSSKYSGLTKISMDDVIFNNLDGKSIAISKNQKVRQFIGMGWGLEPHISKIYSLDFDNIILMTDRFDFLNSCQDLFGLFFLNAIGRLSCFNKFVDLSLKPNKTIVIIESPLLCEYNSDYKSERSFIELWDSEGQMNIMVK